MQQPKCTTHHSPRFDSLLSWWVLLSDHEISFEQLDLGRHGTFGNPRLFRAKQKNPGGPAEKGKHRQLRDLLKVEALPGIDPGAPLVLRLTFRWVLPLFFSTHTSFLKWWWLPL